MILYISSLVLGYFLVGFVFVYLMVYFGKFPWSDLEIENQTGDNIFCLFIWPLILASGVVSFLFRVIIKLLKKIVDTAANKANESRNKNKKIENYIETDMKKLTVMVCGFAGTGKTLIARQIEEFLVNKGYEVDRIPDDDEVNWDTNQDQLKVDALQDEGLEIAVKTVALRYNSKQTKNDVHNDLAEMKNIDLSKEGC